MATATAKSMSAALVRRAYPADRVTSFSDWNGSAGRWPATSGSSGHVTRLPASGRHYQVHTPCVDGGGWNEGAEPADKPGSVVDSHSSRRYVAATLKQPTRIQRGPRQWIPIWSCSRWGLPYRSVARLAV